MSNTGFVDVVTKPAGAGSTSVPGLGTFAPLAGPVVAPDGTVVLGNREGRVNALHPDGSAYWNRQLPTGQTITAAPAIGSDGSAYVVGASFIRDHRDGETRNIGRGTLYRFTPGGGAPPASITQFPRHERGPTTIGPPSVWQFGSDEAIIVPALYPTVGGVELHLLAFSPDGGIMAEWSEFLSGGDVSSDGNWAALAEELGFGGFVHGAPSPPGPPPFTGVAIAPNPDGTPFLAVVDRFSQRILTFRFCVGPSCSPAAGFTELLRTSHEPRALLSAAMIPSDRHAVVGAKDGVVFGGPNPNPPAPVTGLDRIWATPTVAADGRIILVNVYGDTFGLRHGAVSRVPLGGRTLARAAASRTHVFVSTSSGFYTLDANATAVVFTFPWVGGGLWSPVVGPQGHVYAMASNILFVLPPPRRGPHEPHPPVVIGPHPPEVIGGSLNIGNA